jgi:uncharacterized lipoprotein YehR (DUF1307 family)
MKKFSLILIAILIFTLLTGCGKKESAENVIKNKEEL